MPQAEAHGEAPTIQPNYWIQGPLFDLTLLAFPWLPLAALFAMSDGVLTQSSGALAWLVVFTYSLEFIHRQYTYYVVYGDSDAFMKRPVSFVVAPALVIGFVLLEASGRLPRNVLVFTASALFAWEVWHVVMQRYGLFRIYASKIRSGAESTRTAWNDKGIIWGIIVAATPLTYVLHRKNAAQSPDGSEFLALLEPVIQLSPPLIYGAFGAAGLFAAASWFRNERSLELPLQAALPRWSFLGATVMQISVFFLVNPIAGFLCVKLSHAIEYVAFVHLYERRKFSRPTPPRGLLAPLAKYPLMALLFFAGHFVAWKYYLQPMGGVYWIVVYSSVTGILHFLYDGWIWKVRKPEVRRPLMAQ